MSFEDFLDLIGDFPVFGGLTNLGDAAWRNEISAISPIIPDVAEYEGDLTVIEWESGNTVGNHGAIEFDTIHGDLADEAVEDDTDDAVVIVEPVRIDEGWCDHGEAGAGHLVAGHTVRHIHRFPFFHHFREFRGSFGGFIDRAGGGKEGENGSEKGEWAFHDPMMIYGDFRDEEAGCK